MNSAAVNMALGELISVGCAPRREGVESQSVHVLSLNRCCPTVFPAVAPGDTLV